MKPKYRVLMPFIREGLAQGDRAFHVVEHPMVIVGGILQENPFFVPPDVMSKELRERGAAPTCD